VVHHLGAVALVEHREPEPSVGGAIVTAVAIPAAFVRYVDTWLRQDPTDLPDVLATDVHYVESHGPAYRGLAQVQRWFTDWHTHGQVLAWDLGEHLADGTAHVCRWRFTCVYDGDRSTFDGVTWFVLDDDGRIVELREFAATLPARYPYDD
jgi:hypothetical protein